MRSNQIFDKEWGTTFITVSKNTKLGIKTERERIQILDSLADFGRAWKWVNYSQVPPSYFYFSQTYILVRTYIYPIYLSCKTYDMGIVLHILNTSYTPCRSLLWIFYINAVSICIPPIMVLTHKTSHKGCLQKKGSGFESTYFFFKERRNYKIVGHKQNIG